MAGGAALTRAATTDVAGDAGEGTRLGPLLLRAPVAPVASARGFLAAPRGEVTRLALFTAYVGLLCVADPETRGLAGAAIANALDDQSLSRGLRSLGVGVILLVLVVFVGLWATSAAVRFSGRIGGARVRAAEARSIVVFAAWASLLPILLLKLAATALLPGAMVSADPPSLYTAIETIVGIPYLFAALLAAGFGSGLALATACLVDGGFYLAITIFYLAMPSA